MTDDGAPVPLDGTGEGDVLLLTIDVAGAPVRIALDAHAVRAVARVDRITPYPGAPADVPGVTALRGQIVVVLQLTPDVAADRPGVLLALAGRLLALVGATPERVTSRARGTVPSTAHPGVRIWSGRVLPVVGAVRLEDTSHTGAGESPAVPLLDAAALIREVVDDSDGDI